MWRSVPEPLCPPLPMPKVERPYDYTSTMHYGRGPFADLAVVGHDTARNVHTVSFVRRRQYRVETSTMWRALYGQPPTATTISTNPPGSGHHCGRPSATPRPQSSTGLPEARTTSRLRPHSSGIEIRF